MKKILIIVIIFLLSQIKVFWSFWSSWTPITGDTSFDKPYWTSLLKVYEDYIINPFANSVITRNSTNNVIVSYTVDGVLFGSSHILHKNAETIHTNWTTQALWIQYRIDYLENTYTLISNVKTPNQSVKVRKYYDTTFKFDTTKPTCGDLKLYNDINLTIPFSYLWGWINIDKYYTMICSDLETWCKCTSDDTSCVLKSDGSVITKPSVLWHKAQPTASFINNVNIRNLSCAWTMSPLLMYDKSSVQLNTRFNWIDQKFSLEANRTYELTSLWKKYDWIDISWKVFYTVNNELNTTATNTWILTLSIIDKYIAGSMHWVSWVKSFSLNVYRKKITDSIYPSSVYYSTWQTYSTYNLDWTKTLSDIKLLNLNNLSMTESWDYKFILNSFDWAWNETKATFFYNIYPNDLDVTKTTITVSSNGDKYANNSDSYIYTLNLKDTYWNPIYNKNIDNIKQDCNWFTGCKTLKTNMIYNSWDDSLIEYDYTTKSDVNWSLTFKLKSLSPWDFNQSFKVKISKWDDSYNDLSTNTTIDKNLGINNSFKKIFTWILKASKDNWVTWNALPEIWTDMKYRLVATGATIWISNLVIDNFVEFIKTIDSNTILQNISSMTGLTTQTPEFTARINTSDWATSLWIPWIKISNLDSNWNNISPIVLNYQLWWKDISYYLSKNENWSDKTVIDIITSIWTTISNFLWVKIIWTLQWWWKSELTWQNKNFSDLSISNFRTKIRKNSYSYLKNMTNWQVLNWVKYVEWDINISWNLNSTSWNLNYETLIVKNWNVIITWDLNTNWSKLWIIVLKDWYNIIDWYNGKWNVYIKPNVLKINAIIYADWWLISADISWNPYITDNSNRTSALENQLYIKWTLFTRNTIWWAIIAWWYYLLPWKTKTLNFDNAMIYDLNYIRRSNKLCIIISWVCKYNDPFIIEYDSSIQSKPPKLFSN